LSELLFNNLFKKLEKDHDEKRFASKLKPKTYSFDITGKVVEDAGFINYEKILQEVGNIENEDYLKSKPNFADRNFKIDPPKVCNFSRFVTRKKIKFSFFLSLLRIEKMRKKV
jgi:hypothetical protein